MAANAQVVPTKLSSASPPIMAVLASDDRATLRPNRAVPTVPSPVTFGRFLAPSPHVAMGR
jgi:hypothetical protein